MRLDQVGLDAWGHYPRSAALRLPRGESDLHVLWGPNEAGKSTLLAGIDALLFGLPKGHPYGHQYGDPAVALSGEATLADGRALRWARKAGKKGAFTGTLAGESLTEEGYAALLGRVDRVRWRGLFGFSEEQLRLAAKALESVPLSQVVAGEVDPEKVKAELQKAAGELYLAGRTAKNAKANASRLRIEELRRAAEQAAVLPAAWRELVSAEERTRASMEEAARGADLAREELAWARLRRRAHDDLDRARIVREELARLDVPAGLDAGSERQHRALLQHRDDLRRERDSRAADLRREQEERAAILVREDVLSAAEAVEAILAAHGRWQADVEAARGAEARIAEEAQALDDDLADLFPGEADPRRALDGTQTDADARARVDTLARDLTRATEEATRTEAEIGAVRRDLALLEERLAALPIGGDTTAVEVALADEAAELARRREIAAASRRLAELARAAGVARSGLAPVWPEGAPSGPLPAEAEVAIAEGDRARLVAAVDSARATLVRAEEALHERDRRLRGLDAAGVPRTREELALLRRRRDAAWADVRRAWLGGEARGPLEASALSRAMEELVAESDAYADALFADAVTVGERTTLRAELAVERERVAICTRAATDAEAALASWDQAWAGRCAGSGLLPGRPEVIRAFLRDHQAWAAVERERAEVGERWAALAAESARFTQTLLDSAVDAGVVANAAAAGFAASGGGRRDGGPDAEAPGLTLAPRLDGQDAPLPDPRAVDTLIRRARAWVEAALRAKESRRLAEAERATKRATLDAAVDRHGVAVHAQGALRTRWAELLRALGLSEALSASAAVERITRLADLKRRQAALDRAIREQAARRGRIAAWEDEARAVLPPLTHRPATTSGDALADEARRLLRDATRARDRAQELDRRMPGLVALLEGAEARLAEADAALAQARARVGARDDDAYLHLAVAAARAADLRQELSRLEYGLAVHRGSEPAEAFDADVLRAGAEGLDARVRDAEARVAAAVELATDRTRAHEQARVARDAVDGGARAAALRQEVEEKRQELRAHVEDWLAHTLALRLLDAATRRFQEEREPAVLARTGELLAGLTRGRYVEVRPDQAIHRLRAVRPGGEELDPGELSEGTRQQLYLAARLAWAERHCEEEEPLPLVLDDALSAFDDERARAAIEVLARLSRRTQVLVLTHHAHIVALAREVLPGLEPVRLGGGAGPS